MAALDDHRDDDRHEELLLWRRRAEERALSRPSADREVARAVTDVVAEGGFDVLLLGRTDRESAELRARLASTVTERLAASILPYRTLDQYRSLLADHLALDLRFRFPPLDPPMQEALDALDRDWGYRRDLSSPTAAHALTSAPTLLMRLRRVPGHPGRMADPRRRVPQWFDVVVTDRIAGVVPSSEPTDEDAGFRLALNPLLEAATHWSAGLAGQWAAVDQSYYHVGMASLPWTYLRVRPIDQRS